MADFNYIEELHLVSDLPVTDEKLKKALETYGVSVKLAAGPAEAKKRIARYDEMKREYDQKGLVTFRQHQTELSEIRKTQLKDLIALMQELRCAKVINQNRVRTLADALLLKPETVTAELRKSGIEVKAAAGVSGGSILIEDSTYKEIENLLEILRNYYSKVDPRLVDATQQYLMQMSKVRNLYEFLSIFDNANNPADDYRRREASGLSGLCEKLNVNHKLAENSIQTPRKEFKDLVSKAKTQIFKSEETKSKYDHRLSLEESGIYGKLQMMKNYPDGIKLDHSITEGFLTRLSVALGCDRAESIAVYNLVAAPKPALEDEETRIFVTCPTCHNISIWDDEEEAKKAECPNCKTKLYMICPGCGQPVPAAAERCKCGFNISGMHFYHSHYESCKDAIENQNLELAREEYNNARLCNPKGSGLAELKARLDQLIADLEKPLKEITALIGSGKMYAARIKIDELKRQRPQADVARLQKRVNDAINQAAADFAMCRQPGITPARKVDICTQILSSVSDFVEARSEIIANPPAAVLNVRTSPDKASGSCSISWNANPNNRNVQYTVVRKLGSKPVSVRDGTVLGTVAGTSCKDSSIQPGKEYYYAVFAVRSVCPDSISVPTCSNQPVLILKDLTSFKADFDGNSCTLSWQDINDSLGVSVERKDSGGAQWTQLADKVRNSFVDKNIRNGCSYTYRLKTAWRVGDRVFYSEGCTKEIRVEKKPDPLTITGQCFADGNCRISWQAKDNGAVWLYQLNDKKTPTIGFEYDQGQLDGMGQKIGQTAIGVGSFSYLLGSNKRVRVAAFRPFGEKVIAGPAIVLSTIPPLIIKSTSVINGKLHISIDQPPRGVSKILYLVSTNSSKPYATEETAVAGAMKAVDVSAGFSGSIDDDNDVPKGMLYVSVIAQYGTAGSVYYSPAATKEVDNRPKGKLTFRVIWNEEFNIFGRGRRTRQKAKLEVETDNGRIPRFVLCAQRSGKFLPKYIPNSPEIVTILSGPGDNSRGNAEYNLDASAMKGLPENAQLRLFLIGDDTERYEPPNCLDAESLRLPA